MNTFTAPELASILSRTPRAVRLALSDIPASDTRDARGQPAKAWAISALPAGLQTELEHAAQRENFRTPEDLLIYRRTLAAPARANCKAFAPQPKPALHWHADLADVLTALANPQKPTPPERAFLWGEVCAHFEALAAVTPANEHGPLKASLLTWLGERAAALARTVAGLRRNFERKLAMYRDGGQAALADARSQCSGNYRPILCPACWEKAVKLDAALNGNESQAWRRLKLQGGLCPECAERHKFDVRQAKSRVPGSIRARLSPLVDKALPFVKSDAAGRMAGPYVAGEIDTAPADYFWGDDVTWNHKVWATDANGQPYLCRPDCVYLGDDLTGYPVHFDLIAGELGQPAHYNSTDVRRLMLEAHDLLGLPHRGYIFENGVWRSRTVRDESLKAEWLPWFETQLGLKSLKDFVEIRHAQARNPRSKPEGDFRILQERMRTEPGFVGFNQRVEQSDRMKRLERDFAQRVKRGKEHPGNEFLSLAQWGKRIGEILGEFANEPQNGKRLQGRSPAEAFQVALNVRPLRKLPDEARWILATHRQLVTVGNKGIILKGRCYADEQLARYLGRQVWAFYNVECPELLTVCDLKRTEYVTVKANSAPRRTARETAEGRAALSQSQHNIAGFNRMAKVIAGTVPHTLRAFVTKDDDASAAEREMDQHIRQVQTEHRESTRRQTDARTREKSAAANRFRERRAARTGQLESTLP